MQALVAFIFTKGPRGWIGGWSPGIGDPTVAGWVTVALYLAAAALCLGLALRVAGRREAVLWRSLAVAFLLLGVNKQLDVQSALTEIGRMAARAEGWYAYRRPVQAVFVALVTGLGLLVARALWAEARHAPRATRLAVVGAVLVIAFVVVRAASFHHVDSLLRLRWLGLRTNWVLEMGGIAVVIAAALRRTREAGRAGERRPGLAA